MIDLIISYLSKAFAEALDWIIKFIMPIFGFDFSTFAAAFPFAATSYYIFQRVALAIVLVITAWHLIPFLLSWFGIRSDQLRSTPTRQLFQAVLAVVAIYYANYIFEVIINIAQLPFNELLYSDATSSWSLGNFQVNPLLAALNDVFYNTSIILYLIMLVLIGFSLVKVLLEAVERYLVLYILIYLSPLASASLASEETSGIFSKYFSMFISQCLLLLLNVWSIKMAISLLSSINQLASPMLGLLMGYGFLRIAQKLDSYMNQLGLNAAITGSGLGAELFSTGAMLTGKLAGLFGNGHSGSGSSENSSGVLGYGQRFANAFGKFNPMSNLGDTAGAAAVGFGRTIGNAVVVGSESYAGSTGGYSNRIQSAISAGRTHFSQHAGNNVRSSVNSVDNMMTRGMNHSGNAKTVAAMGSEGSVSDRQYSAFSTNPYSAAKAFHSFQENDLNTHDRRNVSTVLEGIGAGKVNPAIAQHISVGYGNLPAKGVDFQMGKNGIQTSYVRNGQQERLSVLNTSQFETLAQDEKFGFQNFKSKSGDAYYYRLDSQKVDAVGGKAKGKS